MPLYEFFCTAGHVTEALKSSGVSVIDCACGEPAQRRGFNRVAVSMGAEADWSSPVRDGTRIRTPIAERRIPMRQYREATEQLAYEHERQEEAAQQPLPSPPLARIALARARKLQAAGITDSKDLAKVTKG